MSKALTTSTTIFTLLIITWSPFINVSLITLSLLNGASPESAPVVYLFHFNVRTSPAFVPSHCSVSALTSI